MTKKKEEEDKNNVAPAEDLAVLKNLVEVVRVTGRGNVLAQNGLDPFQALSGELFVVLGQDLQHTTRARRFHI
jgi:hypothetical protein